MFWGVQNENKQFEYIPNCPVCGGKTVKNMLLSPESDFFYCLNCKIDVDKYQQDLRDGRIQPMEPPKKDDDDVFISINSEEPPTFTDSAGEDWEDAP